MGFLTTVILALLLGLATGQLAPLADFRPPSVPLITNDPYISIWSNNETLYGERTQDWSGWDRTMGGIIRVDGEVYRFMGDKYTGGVASMDVTMHQMSVTVWPTRSIYQFLDPPGRVSLSVQFTTPALPRQWDVSSRPVTYITYNVTSIDGEKHSIQLYYDTTGQISVYSSYENVTWSRFNVSNDVQVSNVMQIGSVLQDYFDRTGDDISIDWGYAYVAVTQEESVSTFMGALNNSRHDFIRYGTLPPKDDDYKPRPANLYYPVLAVAWNFTVDASTSVDKYNIFAYDDIYSIKYFDKILPPYWRRPSQGATVETLLMNATADYSSLLEECKQFDTQLVHDLEARGGAEYATLAALAYRQVTAATKLVWNDHRQMPWVFFKDIDGCGCINTPDIMASAYPFFLYHDPEYLELALLPMLAYANNETFIEIWPYTFAPHDLGVYPVANRGYYYQEHMPMEESGNMLIILAAITKKLGLDSTNLWYPRYWPVLQTWADHLVSTLPDPPNQDWPDVYGDPTPHNANLAIKGIVGLGAFAELCRILGFDSDHDYYASQASSFALQWMDLANDGDHYRRQYDLPNTWSQKYNLAFDRLLYLDLFPPEVVSTELSYYLTYQLKTYGIPVDDTQNWAKLDYTAFVAAMSPSKSQQDQIFETLYRLVNTTPDMLPLLNWYYPDSGEYVGHVAQSSVGALYALMLV